MLEITKEQALELMKLLPESEEGAPSENGPAAELVCALDQLQAGYCSMILIKRKSG
ncbi:hypothetical protein [Parvularcula lutaonensis]|nr:hypothetical protein [Parvularcula lutaonensis]